MLTVYHLKALTESERNRLNDPETGGWDSSPRFSRYADVGMGRIEAARTAWNRGEYEAVAEVTTEDDHKEAAFSLTQHITDSWTLNDNVKALTDRPRSTSVGDLVKDETGAFYIVSHIGFEPIDILECLGENGAAIVATIDDVEYTRGQLADALDLVADREHWKNPIDCNVTEAQIDSVGGWAVLAEAVAFFTGSQLHRMRTTGERINVQAAGYFLSIGA